MKRLLLWWAALAAAASVIAAVSPHDQHIKDICELKICRCSIGRNLTCVCDAHTKELVLPGKSGGYIPTTISSITVDNCQHVRIAGRSIHDITPLRTVTLKNIPNLVLEREAFFWDTTTIRPSYDESGIDISITNSSISELESEVFKGHLNSISLNNVNITTVAALAFANTAIMGKIEFTNCFIQRFTQKSFNKLILDSFVIEGGYIGTFPSNTINAVEVQNTLRFEGVYFHNIKSSALRATEAKSFKLRSCKITTLEGEAFQIATKGDIFIDDNIIDNIHEGAFLGIHLDPREITQKTLVFENNTFTWFEDGSLSLNTSKIKVIFDRVMINQPCECSQVKRWSTKLIKNSPNQNPISYSKFIWCLKGKLDVVVSDFEMKYCKVYPSKIPMVLSIIIGILVFLICICSIGFWLYKKHVKRYMNVPTRDNNRNSMLSTNSGNHMIVVPQRVYKETELFVMPESVEPIKEERVPQVVAQ